MSAKLPVATCCVKICTYRHHSSPDVIALEGKKILLFKRRAKKKNLIFIGIGIP